MMPLHLIKLCVGVSELKEFEDWRREEQRARRPMQHVTRMFPKRSAEILKGGSIYWVVRGLISVRQRILKLEPVTGGDGIQRCRILFDPAYVLVRPTPHRAFQGWRYLEAADAPPDLTKRSGLARLPESLRAELAELGLL
jgi:hypothetical protein